MNQPKLIIQFIIFIIFINFSTFAFKNSHHIFPTVNLKKLPNHPRHCSCHKNELLSKMMAVEFINGNKYLISTMPMGSGGTAMVYHAIYIGQQWKMPSKATTDCVAIKVAKPSKFKNNIRTSKTENDERFTNNNERILNELAILNDIFHYHGENSKLPHKQPSHNLNFLRNEIFISKEGGEEYFAIVMELGEQNLYKYWQKAMEQFSERCLCDKVSETMLLYIMHEISLGLHQLHERNYIFIDLKPENVMIMPNSPDPKSLCDDNFGSIQMKLTDFGAALKFLPESGKRILSQNDRKNLMTSFFYRAPELYNILIEEISPKTDIYSLGRLMLMLAVQSSQIKKFWKELNGDFEENYKNWLDLLSNMFLAANIPPKIRPSASLSSIYSSSRFSYQSDNEIEEVEIRSEKSEIENAKNLKILYDELKRNFGHMMEIIERTQATEQEQRPKAIEIVEECSQKLAHLERNQMEKKSAAHKPSNKSDTLIYNKFHRLALFERLQNIQNSIRTAAVDVVASANNIRTSNRKRKRPTIK